jgi:outer membrane receptor protein involved in Fe transport
MSCAIVGFLASWTIDARSVSMLSAEIGPQPLEQALAAFAHQTGLQVIYVSDLATARQSKRVRAGLSPLDALTQLLDGTGLTFELLNARTVKIFAASVAPAPAATPVARTKRSQWRTTPLANPTERIVVIGSRGEGHLVPLEDVRTVPASVTALDGDSLATQKLDQIADYAAFVPGLSLDTAGVPTNNIVILRGIASFTDSPSAVYYIDDTPIGASGSWGHANSISLDLMPFDLERLEVHRGPQGTSYGAASESGILRYVLKEPTLSRFEARVGADVSALQGASKSGTSIQAVVNVPIVDERLGVRVNAYDRYTPGYIDNAYNGAKDVNDLRRNGGRIAALWRPSEPLSMKVTAFWNRLSAESLPEVSSAGISTVPNTGDAYIVKASRPFGDLTLSSAFLHPWKQSIDYYAATVHWNAGPIEIGSATAWSSMATQNSIDGGAIPAGLLRLDQDIGLEKFTEELRIASRGRRVEWTLGGFYNHESVTDQNIWNAFDTSYQPIVAPSPDFDPVTVLSTFDQRALYGNMTWQITDHLDLTAGLRYDHNDQEFSVFVSGAPVDSGQDSDGVTTWTAAARYRVTPDVMLYGRVATGSQPGISTGSVFSGAEMVTSYEAGLKSEFLDHQVLLDVSVYYIDWTDLVVAFEKPVNAGTAKSQGGELVSSYSPLPGLKLGFIAAFTQCEFTEMAPPADFILTGYQFAQVPKWSMASSADYDWAISNAWHAHVGGSLRWIGRQWGLWVQSQSLGGSPTLENSSYSVLDMNAGIAKDRLAIKVFARNLLDTRAALHSNLMPPDAPTQAEAYILQPRTIGVGFEFSL